MSLPSSSAKGLSRVLNRRSLFTLTTGCILLFAGSCSSYAALFTFFKILNGPAYLYFSLLLPSPCRRRWSVDIHTYSPTLNSIERRCLFAYFAYLFCAFTRGCLASSIMSFRLCTNLSAAGARVADTCSPVVSAGCLRSSPYTRLYGECCVDECLLEL